MSIINFIWLTFLMSSENYDFDDIYSAYMSEKDEISGEIEYHDEDLRKEIADLRDEVLNEEIKLLQEELKEKKSSTSNASAISRIESLVRLSNRPRDASQSRFLSFLQMNH